MMLAQFSGPFGLTIAEFAFVLIGCGYVATIARDWRPIKALREENRGLRHDLDATQKKLVLVEHELAEWKSRTDLSVLQIEHRQIAETLERVVNTLAGLDRAVHANTAAIEMVARTHAVNEALSEVIPERKSA